MQGSWERVLWLISDVCQAQGLESWCLPSLFPRLDSAVAGKVKAGGPEMIQIIEHLSSLISILGN